LVKLSDKVDKVNDDYWRTQKTKQVNDLIAACAGLWFESYSQEPIYAVGSDITVKTQVMVRSNIYIKLTKIIYSANGEIVSPMNLIMKQDTLKNSLTDFDFKYKAVTITQPYWLKKPHGIGTYNVDFLDKVNVVPADDELDTLNDFHQKSLPENIPYSALITFSLLGKDIQFVQPIEYKYTDPARGELYEPVVVAPIVTANIEAKDYIFNSTQPQTVQVKLKAFTKASGSISIKPIDGWKISPDKIDFSDKTKGEEWSATFTVVPTDNQPKTSVFTAVVNANGHDFSMGIKTISYNHIPTITLFPPSQTNLINLDLKTAGKKIGYITGAADLVPDALRQVGYDVHILTESEIMNSDLSVYDAIITGVREYNVNNRIPFEQPKLMDYVKNGGNLVVQYNNNAGVLVGQVGPYPFTVVNQRVTDETAPVTILDPQSAVLNYPNKINNADFDNWIQERGLYFVSNIDPKYQTPLQMNDPNEAPNKGSLIVADYGKGRFVYTSLAFFRELPAGVPGAYRLFVNLLSNPKK